MGAGGLKAEPAVRPLRRVGWSKDSEREALEKQDVERCPGGLTRPVLASVPEKVQWESYTLNYWGLYMSEWCDQPKKPQPSPRRTVPSSPVTKTQFQSNVQAS